MKTKKAKFKPFSLVVETKKELKLLHTLLHQIDKKSCSDIVGLVDANVSLFHRVDSEMDRQSINGVCKDVIFTVYD